MECSVALFGGILYGCSGPSRGASAVCAPWRDDDPDESATRLPPAMIFRRPVPRALLVIGAVLLVTAAVLGVLTARTAGRDDDRVAAVEAARTHLDALAAADPAAADGATGAWRAQLGDLGSSRPTTSVVRTAGLESLDGDAARVLAVGLVAGGTVPRTYRVEISLVRADDRWLVDDVVEL